MKKDFLTVLDLSSDELNGLITRSIELKSGVDANKCPLLGKSIGLLFEKSSTRTRVSLEVGVYQLGGQSIYMNPKEIQIGRGETIHDSAKVLSRYLNGIIIRTYSHNTLTEFASYASIPVVNGLSDLHHPCQALADLMTVYEKKGKLKGLRLAFIGDGNNVAHSLIEAASLTGMHIILACPKGYEPDPDVLEKARTSSSGQITVIREPAEAAANADVVYTDVWVSMGQEKDASRKKRKFKKYQINGELLSHAKKDALVLHCMPAHRGEEITDEVMDSPQSAVFDQAENRLHTQKALLEFLLT
ncbi:MAG: ornithine carbamoyltransferase [Thermodesulfovibrionales bacterium]